MPATITENNLTRRIGSLEDMFDFDVRRNEPREDDDGKHDCHILRIDYKANLFCGKGVKNWGHTCMEIMGNELSYTVREFLLMAVVHNQFFVRDDPYSEHRYVQKGLQDGRRDSDYNPEDILNMCIETHKIIAKSLGFCSRKEEVVFLQESLSLPDPGLFVWERWYGKRHENWSLTNIMDKSPNKQRKQVQSHNVPLHAALSEVRKEEVGSHLFAISLATTHHYIPILAEFYQQLNG